MNFFLFNFWTARQQRKVAYKLPQIGCDVECPPELYFRRSWRGLKAALIPVWVFPDETATISMMKTCDDELDIDAEDEHVINEAEVVEISFLSIIVLQRLNIY